jgi:DNA topoisomerase-2
MDNNIEIIQDNNQNVPKVLPSTSDNHPNNETDNYKTKEQLKILETELNTKANKKEEHEEIIIFRDANGAGTTNSQNCTLILIQKNLNHITHEPWLDLLNKETYGVYLIHEKLENVRDTLGAEDGDIQNLIQILGLTKGLIYEDTKSLRYDSILLMAWNDYDGHYFKASVINFIHFFWPSLIKLNNGFIKDFRIPAVKAKKGTMFKFFNTIGEYIQWRESSNNDMKGWYIKYYKGLDSCNGKEVEEYLSTFGNHITTFQYRKLKDDEAIDLVFNKTKEEERRQWLASYVEGNGFDSTVKEVCYEDFINKELILHSLYENTISIPNICDGLKTYERKILFTCFKSKLQDHIKANKLYELTIQYLGYNVSNQFYDEGITIIKMAQNFVGSNNINLLIPCGQFGTRNNGGRDHADAIYIFTKLNRLIRYLFNEDDDQFLNYLEEEGQFIEPKWYLPIIPMVLVNGAEDAGVGWNTSIFPYNPREIVENIITKINTGSFKKMTPWYKGFQGKVKGNEYAGYIVTGKYEWVKDVDNNPLLVITELPIKQWTKDYKDYLESLLVKNSQKGIVEDFKEYHAKGKIRFEIKLSSDCLKEYIDSDERVLKQFKLQTNIDVSNMVLFGSDLKIKKYNSVVDILEEFFDVRLPYYEKRKDYLLTKLKEELEILNNKVKFISSVINEEILIRKIDTADLIKILNESKLKII